MILLPVCAIVIAMVAATLIGVTAVRSIGSNSSNQILYLLCETGEKNLDSYFGSVEQSVEILSAYVSEDLHTLDNLDSEQLERHIERMAPVFEKTASNTNGVLTYYYRIDPSVSTLAKGFWYTNLDRKGFVEHEVTDITLYDTHDTSKLVWFTVPKATGESLWLPPYITDNLDVRVISYNTPIYWNGHFIGVVGIEIDYSTMAEQVDNITLYDNGYAFINDDEGNIIYHPRIDVVDMAEEDRPKAPEGLLGDSPFVQYTFNGVEKQAVWLPLENGMRLNVTAPVAELNGGWEDLIGIIIIVSVILLIIAIIVTTRLANRMVKPLHELTQAAEKVNDGSYDFKLKYTKDDEIGILTRTFGELSHNLKIHIEDLNSLAYADALTSVRNKGAFDIFVRKLQEQIDDSDADNPAFAVGFFDCDDLKPINDQYGHDKGDEYLKASCHLICRVFQHSPVFRVGGDEFAVILQNDDFENREELARFFEETSAATCIPENEDWEKIRVSMGIAVYDPAIDRTAHDVSRRADTLMYENKRTRKATLER